jgi:L-seryl-tRNA(Ser) seleniumtransferase
MASERSRTPELGEAERGRLMRALPSIDLCLRAALNDKRLLGLGRNYLKNLARRVQDQFRAAPLERIAADTSQAEKLDHILDEMVARARSDEPKLRAVVNATGVVLHTNLGRALLAEAAVEAVKLAATSPTNLEYDLSSGSRGERDSLIEHELCELTQAEAATVVNNNAAAVLLALNTLAAGREVIVSRGELIEIGGSFRLPDVMLSAGVRLKEVGTTNRTHRFDYEQAIGPETALLVKVHPSNYRIVGFTREVPIQELVEIGRRHNVDVIEDLGSGALIDLSQYGIAREPVVGESIAAGVGLVTFSGDKLLGGPQAGVIVGRRDLIARLRRNPLKRALRCDKMTLAALEATLRLYRRGDIGKTLPTVRFLRRSLEEIQLVAERASVILRGRLPPQFKIEVGDGDSEIGSGSLPTIRLRTRVIRITHPSMAPEAISAMFRQARPPVIGRINQGIFLLDCRTIEDPEALAVEFPK